jgi:hypothetical protein
LQSSAMKAVGDEMLLQLSVGPSPNFYRRAP